MGSNPPPKGQFLVCSSEDGQPKIEVRLEGETVWLTQQRRADLFQTTQQNISLHLQNIYAEGELQSAATHKDFLSVRREGARSVQRRPPVRIRDRIPKLNAFLALNERSILEHAGKRQ